MRSIILLLVLAAALSGCAGTNTQAEAGFVDGAGVRDYALDEREPAPELVGETLDGEPVALSDLEGPVVLNVWASWCGPCAAESPHLQAINETYADEGVSVVGVNVRDERTNAKSFERDHGITYPSFYDEDSSLAHELGAVGALPTTLVLDSEHRIATRIFGGVTAAALSIRLDPLLAEAGGAKERGP